MTTVREPRLKPVAVIDLRPTLDGYSGDDDKDPNRPLWKCAAYCESIAAEWAAGLRFGLSPHTGIHENHGHR